MGMFLSKYSMLRALGYGDDSYVLPETKRVLSQFKLFGLIIHDPKVHVEFHRTLMVSFDMLDYITGRDFLFFTVVDLQDDRLRNENRDYFGAWESEKLFDPGNTYQSADKSLTAYSLANTLGIDYGDLPAIILTNNFQFDQFQYIKSCPKQLEFQLREVGFFSSQQSGFFSLVSNPIFKNLIHKIDRCGGSRNVKLPTSMAKLLSDFIAFLVPRSSSLDYSKARTQVRESICMHVVPIEDSDAMDRHNISLLGKLANYYSSTNPNRASNEIRGLMAAEEQAVYGMENQNMPNESMEGLEPESKILYNTYRLLYPHYSRILRDFQGEIDYTPLMISLSKTFELELNLSIVQWIRSYLNIEMPQYFNTHKESVNDYSFTPSPEIVPNPIPVDFNKGYGNKWFPPGIGQSELAAKTLFIQGIYPTTFHADTNGFLTIWKTMRIYRNKATHIEPIDYAQFTQVETGFNSLKEQYLSGLLNLKQSLRN